ncbi:MAG: chemotaxis protein CheW [Pseudohongiellaceae bacterium]|nr:chemotaxis protein CheW [Pseudohongiellaceae bacterium]
MSEVAIANHQEEQADNSVKFVTFLLGGESYAVHASSVDEVLRHTEITPVPGSPSFVLGIINLRGDVLTVIDTREVFGLQPEEPSSHSRIVVVELEDYSVGILVDRVAEVVDLYETNIEPSPNTGNERAAMFIQGVYHYENELLVLVDFDNITALAQGAVF